MLIVKLPSLPGTKPNVVANVNVRVGDVVEAGQELFSIETSKRTVPITATVGGTVLRVLVAEGDIVAANDVLAEIQEEGAHVERDDGQAHSADDAECDPNHVELLIIGAGTGGYVAALYAAKMGKRVMLVERDLLGGTCLHRGCIPTKTLISSALLHRDILRAGQWGIRVEGDVRPDMAAIVDRKDRVVGGLTDGISVLMAKNGVQVLNGTARFDGNGTIVVSGGDERRLTFDDCIVATGSAIRSIDLPGSDLPEVLDTDAALNLQELPASIVVVGGGVTGMEFAFMYANLGVQVTVIARRGRVLHMFDESASAAIMESAVEHSIHIETGGDVKGFSKLPNGAVRTTFQVNGELHEVTSEYVLVAGGRIPLTQGVGLETTDIALDEATHAILVDDCMRTSVDHVYAIGDVNGLVMLAHAASYQARIAVDDILGKAAPFSREVVPNVAYTDPEVAQVGVSVDVAGADPSTYTVGSFSFAHNGKALADNHAEGFASLVTDRDGVLKGATIVGNHASDLIGYIGLAVSAGLAGEEVRKAVFAHPTVSEALYEAACDLTFGALHE